MHLKSSDIDLLVESIYSLANGRRAIIFIAENSTFSVEAFLKKLKESNLKFFGGIFPKIVAYDKLYDEGVIVNFVENELICFETLNLDTKDFSIPLVSLETDQEYCTFTLVDGLTSNISNYLSELYRNFGNKTYYFGGGAGSLTLQQQPCVFTEEGFFMNAAVTIIFETKIGIGVKHGWQKIDGPYVATKTEKNVIKQLNWTNAFDVYQASIQKDANQLIDSTNFFDIAKGYPFGIVKENSEFVVRDPIATNEKGELICVGEVPENTVLDILKGYNNELINSAQEAAEIALKKNNQPELAIIIDCISRVLFLQEEFSEELKKTTQIIHNTNKKAAIYGMLTLGEISSYNEYLEFFNKTIVIGLFSKP